MKKKLLYALTILIFATTYISCSDDDNGDNEPKLVVPEVSVQNLSLKNTILPAQKIKLRANIINKTQADIQWLTNGVEMRKTLYTNFHLQSKVLSTLKSPPPISLEKHQIV